METWKRIVLWGLSIGVGIALTLSLIGGAAMWWSNRLPTPPVWTDRAITAKATSLTLSNGKDEVDVNFEFALTNHTNIPYSLPAVESGSLMRRMPEDGTLDKFENGKWDSTLLIPPGQTFNVKFSVVYRLSDYGTTTAELEKFAPNEDTTKTATKALADFMNRRLSEIDGLVFFDYTEHFRIELPRNWELKKLD